MAKRKKRKKIPRKKNLQRKRKKSVLRKIAKWYSFLTIAALGLYLALGFWLGPGALKKDIEGKVAGASTFLSQHIAGPPAKPVVVTTTGCDEADPYIDLDWDATNDTDDYDVYRDGALLVSGLASTYHRDMNVTFGTNYTYYVVANGPLGSTQSDAVAQASCAECEVPPPPPPEDVVCRITTLDSIDLTNFRCLPKAKKKKPVFSGTVNVPDAQIQAEISAGSRKRKVLSSFTANENGYWSWGVRGQLKKGTKIISVKATDPNDASRLGTCSLRFKIGKAYSRKKMKKCTGAAALRVLSVPPDYKFSMPLALQFKNYQKAIFAGDTVEFETDFENNFSAGSPEQKVNFQLVDSKNNTVYQVEKDKSPDKNGKIAESLKIPLYAGSGQYKIVAQIAKGDEIVTAEKDLAVKEKPFIELNSNWSLTYAELLSSLGWIAMALAAILLIFFGLLLIEYHLSQYAVIQVTEKELKKDGYID